jgi:hypothetical protein
MTQAVAVRQAIRGAIPSLIGAQCVLDALDDSGRIDTVNTWQQAQTFQGAMIRTAQTYGVGTRAKVGGTAGWVVGAANDLGYMATMAASQTAGTLVIPIDGLHVGDTITGFHLVGQIESAGGTVTLDADLRKHVAVAADPSDASVGTITQISVIEDTKVDSTQGKTGLEEVVGQDETFYLLVTGTTDASTDIILLGAMITVTTN